MKAIYKQKGETLDYTNGGSTTIEAGTVVALTARCGIAGGDIAAGAVGVLHMEGVFNIPKDTSNIALGAAIFFDASADKATTTAAGNTLLGYAIAAAGTSATTVTVSIGDPSAAIAAAVATVSATNGSAVSTADATAAGAAYDQTVAQSAVALANASKAQINVLVTLANANKTAINAIIAALKAAGLMANS